ncbi:MAG: hypothetical protein JSW54_02875, partial [Fidelibacterota bacterium]
PLGDIRLSFLVWITDQLKLNYNPISGRRVEFQEFQNVHWKAHHATNFKLTKRFSGLSTKVTPVFYILVNNLFNTKNMFRGALKGSAAISGEVENYMNSLKLEEGDRPGDYGKDYFYLPDPEPFHLFLNPRQIFFGIRLEM